MKNYKEFYKKNERYIKLKRYFDFILSFMLIILTAPLMIYIAIKIKLDSKGPIIFKQTRITKHGKPFTIFKFRTMKTGSQKGSSITTGEDDRITEFGKKIRDYRLDELPQLFNIFIGDMSFVGVRPEVSKYVEHYTKDMKKTLWLNAGVTSYASIKFKDEAKLIDKYKKVDNSVDDIYINKILPMKMKYNLEYIDNFSFITDIKIMIKTILTVIK